MIPSFSKQLAYSYTALKNTSEESLEGAIPIAHIRQPPKEPEAGIPQPLKLTCCSLAFLLIGFFLGQGFAQHVGSLSNSFTSSLTLGLKPSQFKYNAIYGGRGQSDKVWEELIPHGGVFAHPKIAPTGASYAVFEQLQCLNTMREAYWMTLDSATSPNKLNISDIPEEVSPSSVRFCIDLLRQALMCNPDLTIETKNETNKFSATHQCRNWDQLTEFMKKWEMPKPKNETQTTESQS